MSFEEVKKKNVSTRFVGLSLRSNGLLYVSTAAWDIFGDTEYLKVFVDEQDKRIKLQKSKDPKDYKVQNRRRIESVYILRKIPKGRYILESVMGNTATFKYGKE